MKKQPPPERRQNASLREILDDLVSHARVIARQVRQMSPQELEYAQERLEWLADEVWRVATGQERPPA
jgi:hypothetical protein